MPMNNLKPSILVVDDHINNIDILRNLLKNDYKVMAAIDGQSAIDIAKRKNPHLILLDIMMPGISGYDVCKRLKEDVTTAEIPIIFVTAMSDEQDESKGLSLGAVDYITKPICANIVKQRVKTHISLYDHALLLESQVALRTKKIEETQMDVIYRLGLAAEYKDNETGMHVKRMSYFSYEIAKAIGMSTLEAKLIFKASPMHDIGKIGIPDNILQKPGKLDKDEWSVMQTHAVVGAEILKNSDSTVLSLAETIALTHHEKWDGSGYPNGLSGEDIPLSGRIVAIADVYDALTSIRPYKKAWSVEDACTLIKSESGKHFEPALVEAFLGIIDKIVEIQQSYKN